MLQQLSMDASATCPFTRKLEELPGPLPTSDQVRKSQNVIHGFEPWADHKVVAVGPYVIKYEKNLPQVPAPKLFAMWREPEIGGDLFTAMEFLDGKTLESLWPTLMESDKIIVLDKLRNIVDSLHSLRSPGYIGSVLHGPVPYHLFWDSECNKTITGPFYNGHDVVLGLAKKSRANSALNNKHPHLAEFFERHLAPSLQDHHPTFCHSDIQRKNIIVTETVSTDPAEERDLQVSLVDWEIAGWYPSYWEYAVTFLALRWDEDDRPEKVERFLPVSAAQAAMLKLIHQYLWV